MTRSTTPVLGIVLGASILAMPFIAVPTAPAAGAVMQVATFPAQTNNEGQVSVTITPLDLSGTAETWRFDVQLNTHVTPLDQDLAQIAVLIDAGGREVRALSWQGDPPGGHHRHGVLIFERIRPAPLTLTLKLGRIGSVAERSFTWSLAKPSEADPAVRVARRGGSGAAPQAMEARER